MYSSDWEMNMMDRGDELSALSRYSTDQEANNDFVLESWLNEQDPSSNGSVLLEDDEDMMMLDVGFDPEETPPTPPTGRLFLEEALADTLAAAVHQGDDDDDSYFATHSDMSSGSPSAGLTSFLPLEQRYQASLDKLAASMKKSQETRKSLRMQTAETAEYTRWGSVSGTLSSIEKSTQQLQTYLGGKNSPQVL